MNAFIGAMITEHRCGNGVRSKQENGTADERRCDWCLGGAAASTSDLRSSAFICGFNISPFGR
jgi:hypothetical protein